MPNPYLAAALAAQDSERPKKKAAPKSSGEKSPAEAEKSAGKSDNPPSSKEK